MRTKLMISLALLICFMASSEVVADSQDELIRCGNIDSGRARLLCFDQLVQRACLNTPDKCADTTAVSVTPLPEAVAQPTVSSQPEMTAQAVADAPSKAQKEPVKARRSAFGFFGKKAAKAPPEVIKGNIIEIKKSIYGKHIFTLDNGQVWMENERSTRRITSAGQKALISKKKFSYHLKLEPGGNFKVHRVR